MPALSRYNDCSGAAIEKIENKRCSACAACISTPVIDGYGVVMSVETVNQSLDGGFVQMAKI